MHAQIVLCPDWNDGAHLDRSVHELARLHPAVATTAVVPVGLTRHRERLPELRTVTDEEARALVRRIEGWQREFLDSARHALRLGRRRAVSAGRASRCPPARDLRGLRGRRGRHRPRAALRGRLRRRAVAAVRRAGSLARARSPW